MRKCAVSCGYIPGADGQFKRYVEFSDNSQAKIAPTGTMSLVEPTQQPDVERMGLSAMTEGEEVTRSEEMDLERWSSDEEEEDDGVENWEDSDSSEDDNNM